MRINHPKRIFMNEADASPGGGTATPAPAAPPASTPAQEATPAVSIDQVKNLMSETLTGFKNALFADMRKAGALGKEKPNGDSTTTPTATPPAAAPATSGLTEADLEARLEQERVITRVQVENKLSEAAIKRMKSALKAEKPDDIAAWTSSYLADLGLVRTTDPSTPSAVTAPTVAPNGAPASDKGSPAPSGAVGWRHEFAQNPIGMSKAAREQMDAELGAEKARKQRLDASRGQAERMRVDWKA